MRLRRPGVEPVATNKPAAKNSIRGEGHQESRRGDHDGGSVFRRSAFSGDRERPPHPDGSGAGGTRSPRSPAAAGSRWRWPPPSPSPCWPPTSRSPPCLSQHRQLSAAAAQLHQIQSANRALSEQDQQLNSTTEIDRLARQDYQLVSPNQTLYNVLPPSGRTASTTPGGPTSGDPGDQATGRTGRRPRHVARSRASPGHADLRLLRFAGRDHGDRSSAAGSAPSAGSLSSRSSFWSRVTDTLEFWK